MNLNKILLTTIMMGISASVLAFGLPPLPGTGGGSSSSSTVDAKDVIKQSVDSLVHFYLAETKIQKALGVYQANAANDALIAKCQKGDCAKGDDINAIVSMDQATIDVTDKAIAEGKKLDASQKQLGIEGTVEYIKAIVTTKKLLDSVQSLAKNPSSLGFDAVGPIKALATNLPSIVPKAVSTSSTLIKYMAANGMDKSTQNDLVASLSGNENK